MEIGRGNLNMIYSTSLWAHFAVLGASIRPPVNPWAAFKGQVVVRSATKISITMLLLSVALKVLEGQCLEWRVSQNGMCMCLRMPDVSEWQVLQNGKCLKWHLSEWQLSSHGNCPDWQVSQMASRHRASVSDWQVATGQVSQMATVAWQMSDWQVSEGQVSASRYTQCYAWFLE